MNGELLVSSGGLAALIMEGIKLIVRKWIVKDMNYDFDPKFYAFMLPLVNAITPFVMVALGVASEDPILTMDFQGVVKYLILVALSTLTSMLVNDTAIAGFKFYSSAYVYRKNEKEAEKAYTDVEG